MLSLIVQGMVCFYLDQFYLSDETGVKITSVNLNQNEELDPHVIIPLGARKIGLSYDGHYTSYLEKNGNLVVVDTNSGRPEKVEGKNVAYKWLPDANILMLAETLNVRSEKVLRFFSYDVQRNIKSEICNYNKKQNIITVKDDNPSVDIAVSTLTGVMYVKITDGNESRIYRIDRNETLTRILANNSHIVKLEVASHDDLLAYQDDTHHQIRTTASKRVMQINGNNNLFLLAADGNDNIYAGNSLKGKISEIYYGKLNDPFSSWEKIDLGEYIDSKDIFITYRGDIYVKRDQNSISNIRNIGKINYYGQFLGIFNGFIASIDNHKLMIEKIEY